MEMFIPFIAFVVGTVLGILIMFFVTRQNEGKRQQNEKMLVEFMKSKFGSMSLDALNKSNEHFLTLAEQRFKLQTQTHSSELTGKKTLIDSQLQNMNSELGKVTSLVKEFEEKRSEKLGALSSELDRLSKTSTLLQQALADNRARGQWGERIAEDILRLSGFVEGINYTKQTSIEIDGKKTRPDFTFNLPNSMTVNMDCKFPLDNYLKFLEVEAQADKVTYRKNFLSDIRGRVKEIGKRNYITPEQNTVDCVLIFIPNEQIYRFIHEEDSSIIDEALKEQVIICSPITLYIVLAVIRQSVENFKLEQSSKEILKLLNEFKKQWEQYTKKMGIIGSTLDKAREAYDELVGTRTKALERPINKIETLRLANGIKDEDVLELIEA
jgi:DNA recombination protein RmuC